MKFLGNSRVSFLLQATITRITTLTTKRTGTGTATDSVKEFICNLDKSHEEEEEEEGSPSRRSLDTQTNGIV